MSDMEWIENYQLFLFDFDGVLVDTERLHYLAYIQMCANRGFHLDWDQHTYMQHALYTATGVQQGIYQALPKLQQEESNWQVLYAEKKEAYLSLLEKERVSLMPGVEALLHSLAFSGKKRCVVTHSPKPQIDYIREQLPLLDSIPHWITREHYTHPKPAAECYLHAIHVHKEQGDRVIGFEDSPRGLQALLGTEAKAVWISSYVNAMMLNVCRSMGQFVHYPSFIQLSDLTSI